MLALFLLLPAAAPQPIDTFADVAAWSVNSDGSQGVTFRHETTVAPNGLRIVYDASGTNKWGNLARAVTVPQNAVAVTMRMWIVAADAGAAMHLWAMEADGDGYVARITTAGTDIGSAPKGVWHDVTVPLGTLNYQPRGNGAKGFLTVNKLLLGSNYAPLDVVITDLAWAMDTARGGAPMPVSTPWQVVDGQAGRIGLLADSAFPKSAAASDPEALEPALKAAGFGVTRLLAGDLCKPERLAEFDVLVLPQGPAYPAQGRDALFGYLKAGGAFVASGGYAFDDLVEWTGEAWVAAGTAMQAQDLDRGQPQILINSRIGKPGDTMVLPGDRIGLFDPSDQFEQVDHAVLAEDRIDGPLEGFVGRSMAGSNSPVFPDQHGETVALGTAYDRFNAERGHLGVVAQFFAGPFTNAGWAGFGVTNRDLFGEDGLGRDSLVDVVRQLADGVFIHSLTADPPMLEAGETATITVQVRRRGRLDDGPREVTLKVNGQVITQQQVNPDRFGDATVTAKWTPAGQANPIELVEAQLADDNALLMTRETALLRRQPAVIAAGPKVEWRDNQLFIDGGPGTWVGTNQTGVMWHSPRENPLTWERDFQAMADHGHRIWRILHFSPFAQVEGGPRPRENPMVLAADPPEKLRRQTDAIVQLAQRHGVVIMLCAHDWIGTAIPDDQLEAQRKWNRFWAERYKDVPGFIWDIQNEPSVQYDEANPPQWLCDQYRDFAIAACGSEQAARELLKLPAGAAWKPVAGMSWDDPAGVMRERFRTWLIDRWVRVNLEGLREGDSDAIVTVGWLQSRPPADKILGSARLNFSNMHSYEAPRNLPASLKFIDRRAYGGGLGLGEFGQRQSHDARSNGQFGDRRDLDQARFSTTAATVMGLGGNMLNTWFWRDLPDVIFPWGIQTPDRRMRPWVAELDAWCTAMEGIQPVYEPPALYVLVPDGQRLGNDFGRFDRAIEACFDTLLGLDVPFACLTETELPFIPEEAKALVWPIPYAPSDKAFDAIAGWVKSGGSLYVSGGLGYDTWRRPTRADRYAKLGLPARQDTPPDPAQVSGQPAIHAGQVTFVPEPAELGDKAKLRERYAEFLKTAGIGRLPVSPDTSEVHAYRVKDRDGAVAWIANSWGETRTVQFDNVGLSVAAEHGGMVQFGPDGDVETVIGYGPLTIDGKTVCDGPGYLLRSRDGGDIRSAAVALLPLAPGTVRLARTMASKAALQDGGEVAFEAAERQISVSVDDVVRGRWISLTASR